MCVRVYTYAHKHTYSCTWVHLERAVYSAPPLSSSSPFVAFSSFFAFFFLCRFSPSQKMWKQQIKWRDVFKRKGWTRTWKVGRNRKDALINKKKGESERTWGHLKHLVFCYLSLSQCPSSSSRRPFLPFLVSPSFWECRRRSSVDRWAHVAFFLFLFCCEPPTALCRTLLMCVVGVTPPNKSRTWDAKSGWPLWWGLWGEGGDEMDVLLGRRKLLCAAVCRGVLRCVEAEGRFGAWKSGKCVVGHGTSCLQKYRHQSGQ